MTQKILADLLVSSSLFHEITAAALGDLAEGIDVLRLKDGQILVRQGDLSQCLYLVIEGRLRVSVCDTNNQPRLVFDCEEGESVSEMGILCDDPASATIVAHGDVQIAALSRTSFARFSSSHPYAALQITEAASRRQKRHRISVALHISDLFRTLSADAISHLEAELEMFSLYGGEVLFRKGDPGDFVGMVISGRLRVYQDSVEGRESAVVEIGPGELVGEMEVMSGQARSVTVEAARDTQLAKLTRSAFEGFALQYGKAAVEMVSRKISERMKERSSTSARWHRSGGNIAVIPVHASSPKSEFAASLTAALTVFGETMHLTSAEVDRHLGQAGIAQTYERAGGNIRVVEWLNKQEFEHAYVVYEADPSLSPWTERCIRQADYIIIVGESAEDPTIGEIESELLNAEAERIRARQWLVLMHREGNPTNTGRWLAERKVERHFHARFGDAAAFARLTRVITGRGMGLTLGGGFARGLAHVGVFNAFEDLGIGIDVIGGASMGALVGALWAMGWSKEKIIAETCSACSEIFGDLTFPFIAFKSGRKFSTAVRRLFGDIQIEDLYLPYFCISANLNRSELRVHTQGPLAKAVLAATRAPGVFPPIVYEGELHVDGGVINNVPVDLMKSFSNNGIVVGVDVSPPHELNAIPDYGDNVSGWSAFWKRCSPFSKNRVYTPSILLVMIRTLEYTGISHKNLRVKFADVYMYPELLKFKRTDFHLVTNIAQAGYDCAQKNLTQWLSTPDAVSRRPDLARAFDTWSASESLSQAGTM
ncbi:MAG TPA: cyclic nucleotide-binding and patatin-like phospholipase domain-containing protein [Bryobacteraceae bacterium]|nr:cyclic nucleotide-binding and patatin-like phospholipase domain-containing protein [Bryobacteraceae bacterium]